jgi:hypothetical protein
MAKKIHPISEPDAKMNPAVLEKARGMAQEESLNIRLGMLGGEIRCKTKRESKFYLYHRLETEKS